MPIQFNTLCQESTLYEAWNVVKSKGSAGGIDGVTIEEFNKEKIMHIRKLREDLVAGEWKPQPYLQIAIPKTKDPSEMRILGMAAVRDKIVQQAIRKIIEPRYEKIFLGNSYGYRPGKGATKAIRRVLAECHRPQYKYVLRLDIDNFFDAQGTHLGSIILSKFMQNTLWSKQAEADFLLKNSIALGIIEGKIKNQHAYRHSIQQYVQAINKNCCPS